MNSKSKFCPSCGEPNQKEAKFCKSCGKPFRDAVKQPTKKPEVKDETRPIDLIARLLAKPPYPIIFTMKEFIKFYNDELGEKGVPAAALGDFFSVESQFTDFLDNQMHHYRKVSKMMKASNISGEIKNLEKFWNEYSWGMMQETMRSSFARQPVDMGSQDAQNKFVAIIMYFLQNYPELIDREAFAELPSAKQKDIQTLASLLDNLIYRFNKDINCENEPMQDAEKYIIYNIQKFLMSISLKLPLDRVNQDDDNLGNFLRHAFNLYRYQVKRTKLDLSPMMFKPNQIIVLADIVKAFETLLDLQVDLRKMKDKTHKQYRTSMNGCMDFVGELFTTQSMYSTKHHDLILRWINDSIDSLEESSNPIDLDYALAVKPFMILVQATRNKIIENEKYHKISEEIYTKSQILLTDYLAPKMLETFNGLQNRYGEVGMIFDFKAYQFREEIEKLEEMLEKILAEYESRPSMYFKIALLMRNGLVKAGQDFKQDSLVQLANKIHTKIQPEKEIDDKYLIKLKDLEELGFIEGEIPIEDYSDKTFVVLGDTELAPAPEMTFQSIKSDTKTQTLRIKEGSLSSYVKNLPQVSSPITGITYDMEQQTVMRGDDTLYALITVDQDNKLDGLLFNLRIEVEEIEAHTTINYPGGSRAGVPRIMKMASLKSIHFKGIAVTDGPLGSGKMTLQEYLQSTSNKEKFKKAKRYYMPVEKGDFPMMTSLIS